MRYLKGNLTLAAMSALVLSAHAQSFSGTASTLASCTGGHVPFTAYTITNATTPTVTSMLTNEGPGVNVSGNSKAGPGRLWTTHNCFSESVKYGQSWGKAVYRDTVRWTGALPITVIFRARLLGNLQVTGNITGQTSAGAYAYVAFQGSNSNGYQTYQRALDEKHDTVNGGIGDRYVTFFPGRWYTINTTLQSSGDSADQIKPYAATSSKSDYTLLTWFDLGDTSANPGTIQSASGHDYTVNPLAASGLL